MYDLTICPFCGAVPQCYDGDYKIEHDSQCWISRQGDPVEWLTSPEKIKRWETRAPGTCIFNEDKQ